MICLPTWVTRCVGWSCSQESANERVAAWSVPSDRLKVKSSEPRESLDALALALGLCVGGCTCRCVCFDGLAEFAFAECQ